MLQEYKDNRYQTFKSIPLEEIIKVGGTQSFQFMDNVYEELILEIVCREEYFRHRGLKPMPYRTALVLQ
jgi:hypothetical protein